MTKRKSAKAKVQTGDRLQKFIATSGVASRRLAEELIAQGRIEVNGVVITEPGTRIDPELDQVRFDGEKLKPQAQRVVLLLHKPVGFLSSAKDPDGRPLVYHLVPKDLALRTIGRLDFNTEGVLLFTNDGELAERLGHARYSVQRVYEARVRGIPTEMTLAALRRGVRLEDGPARVESVEIVKATENNAWLRLVLVEGRNREVRRLMERVGHPVVRLRRVAFAGLTVGALKHGDWRILLPEEVDALQTRGHVGAFELPPDPRRKVGAQRLEREAKRGQVRAETRDKPAAPRSTAVKPPTRGRKRLVDDPTAPPAQDRSQRKALQQQRISDRRRAPVQEILERETDGHRRTARKKIVPLGKSPSSAGRPDRAKPISSGKTPRGGRK